MSADQIAEEEKQRLTSLLFSCGIPEERIDALLTVIENTAWMKVKLDETRETIRNTAVAIPFDNGGGQKGIKVNPLYTGYQGLWKSYMAGMNVILSHVPQKIVEDEAKKIDTPQNVLQLVQAKHKKTG